MARSEPLIPLAPESAKCVAGTVADAGCTQPAVVIVINALHSGGAEKTCVELARALRNSYRLHFFALLGGGPAADALRDLGVEVTVPTGSAGLWARLRLLGTLAASLRHERPIAVITFLYVADFLGGALARLLAPQATVFWNIRNNVLKRGHVGAVTYAATRLNALLSARVPHRVVFCSALSREQHAALGYRAPHSDVVENSPAAIPFAFSADKRARLRRRFGDDAFLFLFVGRFDPVKRVDLFIDASGRVLRAAKGRVRFVLAGRGMEAGNRELLSMLQAAGAAERFELLGYVDDQQMLYSAADCLVVTSESEGSSNVIYEAMATRLRTLILGTLGTESLTAVGIRRLATRDVGALADAMVEIMGQGVAPEASRIGAVGSCAACAEHPLVAFYRRTLCAT